MRKGWVLNTVSNVKIASHDEKVLNVCLKILKIL